MHVFLLIVCSSLIYVNIIVPYYINSGQEKEVHSTDVGTLPGKKMTVSFYWYIANLQFHTVIIFNNIILTFKISYN